MKNLIILLSIAFGCAAHAEYKVGDRVNYAAVLVGENFDLNFLITAVDSVKDSLTLKESIIYNGNLVKEISGNEKISDLELNEQIFDLCLQMPAKYNPRYETITVPAGVYNTCHMTSVDETGANVNGYYGQVMFGIVKWIKENSTDHSDMDMELKSFKKL